MGPDRGWGRGQDACGHAKRIDDASIVWVDLCQGLLHYPQSQSATFFRKRWLFAEVGIHDTDVLAPNRGMKSVTNSDDATDVRQGHVPVNASRFNLNGFIRPAKLRI